MYWRKYCFASSKKGKAEKSLNLPYEITVITKRKLLKSSFLKSLKVYWISLNWFLIYTYDPFSQHPYIHQDCEYIDREIDIEIDRQIER